MPNPDQFNYSSRGESLETEQARLKAMGLVAQGAVTTFTREVEVNGQIQKIPVQPVIVYEANGEKMTMFRPTKY